MELYSFLTIEAPATGLFKDKGSKFISFAFPVTTMDEIKYHLEALRKEYFDARHHCFAWILGPSKDQFRAFDDGEPNHTAGDPILGQIRSRNLTNVLVVVVRYFGGTKLGVSGLISAYRLSADDALSKCSIIEKELSTNILLEFDYTATPEVMRMIKEFTLVVTDQQFESMCRMRIDVLIRNQKKVKERMDLLIATGTKLQYTIVN